MPPLPDLLSAVLLGVVQGVTEFLPVSSTAHLVVVPRLLGIDSPLLNSLSFDAALHLGTLAALLAAFGADIARLAKGLARPTSRDGRLGWWIGLGSIPALAAGKLLEDRVSGSLRSPLWVAAFLAAGAVILLLAQVVRKRGTMARLSAGRAVAIGCSQALALLPGLSRSGITMSAGLLAGLSRPEAARFSFLLGVPVIAAAGAWQARHLGSLGPGEGWLFAAGILGAAGSGAVAARWLIRFLGRAGFGPFIAYRFALAFAIVLAAALAR
jgi:undecaprenyl-diphosphatase